MARMMFSMLKVALWLVRYKRQIHMITQQVFLIIVLVGINYHQPILTIMFAILYSVETLTIYNDYTKGKTGLLNI